MNNYSRKAFIFDQGFFLWIIFFHRGVTQTLSAIDLLRVRRRIDDSAALFALLLGKVTLPY